MLDGIIKLMHHDKKSADGSIRMVLLKGIGSAIFGATAPDSLIKKALSEILATS